MKKKYKKEEVWEEEIYNYDFSFIAGYTNWGVPYGVTWQEIGIDQDLSLEEKLKLYEKQNVIDDDNPLDIDSVEDLPF